MGLYKHLTRFWRKKSNEKKTLEKDRLIEWRRQSSILRINRPTRIDKARRLGYKAKQGITVVRAKVRKGTRKKQRPKKGRRPKRMGTKRITAAKSKRRMAEERVAKKFPNLEVLNAYFVGSDSVNAWYEVILVDPSHTAIKKDKDLGWITKKQHKRRVFRGKTAAGKKGRGLYK
jgi:large subunit ribosomal protein L15e